MKMTDWEFPRCVRRPERKRKKEQVVSTVTKKRDEDAYPPRPLDRECEKERINDDQNDREGTTH
jgi:hypothetical protein